MMVKKLSDEIDEGTYQFDCHPMMVRQNKWRAARYGMSGKLVHARDYRVEPVTQIACDLVDRLRNVAQYLGCEDDLLYVKEITRGDGWADRQREVMGATGSPAAVVEQLSDLARLSDFHLDARR